MRHRQANGDANETGGEGDESSTLVAATRGRRNREAVDVARRMVEKSAKDEYDEDNAYDSDDERWCGGEYFWHLAPAESERIGFVQRGKDYARLCAFLAYRLIKFVLEVLLQFLGMNQSRFQWALDKVNAQQEVKEREAIERLKLKRAGKLSS